MACGHEHNQRDICPGENLISGLSLIMQIFSHPLLSLISFSTHLRLIPVIMFNIPFPFSPLAVRLMQVSSSEDTPLRAVKQSCLGAFTSKLERKGRQGRDGLACICSLPSSHFNFDNYFALFSLSRTHSSPTRSQSGFDCW